MRVDDQSRGPACDHVLDGWSSHYRHIEAHVLLWLADLDHGEISFVHQLSGPPDDRIGPLHRFNGDYRSISHHDRLANIHACDPAGQWPPILQIGGFAKSEERR